VTLIVGMNLGSYALLGADTRVSYYPHDRLMYRDDSLKIRRIGMGLITGAGFGNLLDDVKGALDDDAIEHTDIIRDVVNREVEDWKRHPWYQQTRVRKALDETGWMFSYVTGSLEQPDKCELRLAVLGTDNGPLGLILKNKSWLFPPTGTTQEQGKEWFDFLKDSLRPLERDDDLAKNIAHHIGCVYHIMEAGSEANEGVAKTFQIGIHVMPRAKWISNIITEDLDIQWDFGNEAS
jgi:hypothetical protein